MNFFQKKHLILICTLIIVLLYLNFEKINVLWVKFFERDATFFKVNSDGKVEGRVTTYVSGKIYVIGNVIKGIKEGWEIMYYDNGNVKSKTFFIKGKPSGEGFLYKDNGLLEYSGRYLDGKPYGSWYSYDDQKIKQYLLYDIKKNISFTLEYEADGKLKLKDMHGFVVSPNFYSINVKSKAIIPLNSDENPNRLFDNINDLYITVANPRYTKLSVTIKINENSYRFPEVINNTIKISNAFSKKTRYEIFIESHLHDLDGNIINGINLKDVITRL